MTGYYDPSIDPDDHLPPGPRNETFAERLIRLGIDVHGMAPWKLTPQELAHRARTEPPYVERLDAIFRKRPDAERNPAEEG